MSFYSREELAEFGFKHVGENVLISKKSSIYNPGNIELGSNVRIDDFCVLSAGAGGIKIGNYIHIAVYSSIIGAGQVTLSDYCNISSRVAVYSSNDDYSGEFMTNPMVPSEYTGVSHANVFIGPHAIIGSGSVLLPGITIETGVAIGALSLVAKDCEAFTIYAGSPLKKIKDRKRNLLEMEKKLNASLFLKSGG
ncbi:MAG: acyltransferase [Pseudomonadota bacterium]|nr:acyltransferase [Pseudomonadota bacterium]